MMKIKIYKNYKIEQILCSNKLGVLPSELIDLVAKYKDKREEVTVRSEKIHALNKKIQLYCQNRNISISVYIVENKIFSNFEKKYCDGFTYIQDGYNIVISTYTDIEHVLFHEICHIIFHEIYPRDTELLPEKIEKCVEILEKVILEENVKQDKLIGKLEKLISEKG